MMLSSAEATYNTISKDIIVTNAESTTKNAPAHDDQGHDQVGINETSQFNTSVIILNKDNALLWW